MNQLERDTATDYENMCEEELKAERDLENAIAGAAQGIDFDTEESPLTQTALWTKLCTDGQAFAADFGSSGLSFR